MLFEIVLLVFILIGAFEYFVRHGRIGKLVNKIPGDTVWPILGNLPSLFGSTEQVWNALRNWDLKYYPIYRVWALHKPIMIILHPDDIEKVFTSPKYSQKSFFYYPLFAWLRTGLLTSHGEKWQKRRKMLTPAFHFNILKQYFEGMAEHGEKTMNNLKSQDESVYNINKLVADFTLHVICETAMGVKFEDEEIMQKYRDGIHYMGDCIIYRITKPWFASEPVFRLLPQGQKYKEYLNILHGFTRKILKERKEYHEQSNGQFLHDLTENESVNQPSNDVYCSGYRKKQLAMLDLLIMAQKNDGSIDDQGIQEEVDTFTFEGHDTTAMSLTYAILLIAEHKDAQTRIRNEVNEVISKAGKLGMSEIQSLTYLEMCLKESLRLYPIVPYMSRNITEDIQLTNYLVPKGAAIQVNSFSVHRVPEFWPNPEKFDPDRFLPENTSRRHPFSYIPFSAGPRNCIGQRFAMMELKTFISLLVHNFYLEPITTTSELSFISDMILRTSKPIRVKLIPIKIKLSALLRQWDIMYYPMYKVRIAHKAVIVILHPDDIEKLFTSVKHTEKSYFYYPLLAWLGTGLLTSHGAKWQQRRKMLTPAFHFNILKQYFESMSEHAKETMKSLKTNGEVVINMTKCIANFTLDVILETAMGVKFTDREFSEKYREGVHHVGDCTIFRIINPWFALESVFRLTHRGQKYKKSLTALHDFTKKIMAERKKYHEKTNYQFFNEFKENISASTSTGDIYCGYRKKRLAMLDLLISEQKAGRIDDKGIQEEVDTFTFEGHDTTAMALSYAVLLIAENKDAQSRIRNEVSEFLDCTGGKLEISDTQRFTYLEMCLKESLRLYPIVPYISRNITEDLQLTNYLIPKGTMIQVHPYSVHRLPEFWPNPEKFDPTRFLPANAKARHPYSYIPFSAGPRNCIGQKFAMLELKTFVSLLVYNFELDPISRTEELIFKTDLVLRTTEPIRIKLTPIKR
ncbi:cytochrome P450 4C1-like [Phymastichus coffea]|uniref:cytochrome P450 4C1-like n=1 Tax=Phymastichus coffea TaxID=108790 RepID=UPI00273C1443|nr:cytochrome P450 4C1-like [Phymastichus coffea]